MGRAARAARACKERAVAPLNLVHAAAAAAAPRSVRRSPRLARVEVLAARCRGAVLRLVLPQSRIELLRARRPVLDVLTQLRRAEPTVGLDFDLREAQLVQWHLALARRMLHSVVVALHTAEVLQHSRFDHESVEVDQQNQRLERAAKVRGKLWAVLCQLLLRERIAHRLVPVERLAALV